MVETLQGTIKLINKDKKYGYIQINGKQDHVFFLNNIGPWPNGKSVSVGDVVKFNPYPPQKDGLAPIARDVILSCDAQNEHISNEEKLSTPSCILNAFNTSLLTHKSDEFEESIFTLLRILGIHYIFRFPSRAQAGKSDGFFKIQGLAVIYDCTLNERFLGGDYGDKTDQIANYVSVLMRGTVELRQPIKMKAEFSDAQKQVWIVTRRKSGMIQEINGIPIKQIDTNDIIRLIERRLTRDSTYKEQQLADDLISLGNLPLEVW